MQIKLSEAPNGRADSAAEVAASHRFIESVSPAMHAIERVIAEIGPTAIPVLLVGEKGTGKEALALRIHRLSPRRDATFVKLGCTGLRPGSQNGGGFPVPAGAGTLFLDEICDLHPDCQPELVHALSNGDSPGSQDALEARLICSTSRDLEEEMRAGRFREELYYQINGICLRLPPLRHRHEDIPLLAVHFLRRYATAYGRPQPSLSAPTLEALVNYSWPGNIRELENTMRKVVMAGDERVALAELTAVSPPSRPAHNAAEAPSLKDASRAASRQAERELILKTLTRTRWNRKRAARELQISYKALLYKLKQMGLDDSGDV